MNQPQIYLLVKNIVEVYVCQILSFAFLLLTENSYKPYTLVGPTVTRPVKDPLAVKPLDMKCLWLVRLKCCFIFSVFVEENWTGLKSSDHLSQPRASKRGR